MFQGDGGQASPTTPVPNPNVTRVPQRGDVAERIKAGSQGLVSSVVDVAVRKGTELLLRPSGPSSFFGVLSRDGQNDTVELFDGKSPDPVQTAEFPTE